MALATWLALVAGRADALVFDVALDPSVASRPATGRVYVFLASKGLTDPRNGPDWFHPEPFFGLDVKNFAPGTVCRIDAAADGFPAALDQLPAGKYRVQAVLDQNLDTQHHARGPGNLYSAIAELNYDGAMPLSLPLVLDKVTDPQVFHEEPWLREVVIRSELLSQFHGRDVREYAAVVLPAEYAAHPERRYPVIYTIPGFGGSHREALKYRSAPVAEAGDAEFIRVLLSGNCKWGHHVYADSATNGPRGRALVEELIPYIDRNFRTIPAATARFVTGHSSGGWASLWLQVNYPETFGGVWSTAPDPVDFRDYQCVNLYAEPPLNMYRDEQGQRRPIARQGTKPVLWYEDFTRLDDVLARGGQLRSFEAVFSPLDAQGQPRPLWNRATGQIDPEVAQAWQQYDISLKLQREWPTLGPKLQGKLHVITGGLDTFYLDGAVRKLSEVLESLGSDAEVIVVPERNHNDLVTKEMFQTIRRQMTDSFLRHHPQP